MGAAADLSERRAPRHTFDIISLNTKFRDLH